MRLFYVLLLFTLALNLSSCKDRNDSNRASEIAKESLLDAIHEFNKAFKEGNNVILASMITANYSHTNGNSKSIGKIEWLGYLNKRKNEIESGNLEVLEYKMDEIKIDLHGDMALVTGKINVVNIEKEEIRKSEYRITNIWVHEDGNWKRAGFHDGKIQ